MRLRVLAVFFLLILFPDISSASGELVFVHSPEIIYPGKAERITLNVSAPSVLSLDVLSADGTITHSLRENMEVNAGDVTVTFNGIVGGSALPAGEYQLRAAAGGCTQTRGFTVGEPAPQILSASASSYRDQKNLTLTLNMNSSKAGTLNALLVSPEGGAKPLRTATVDQGANTLRYEKLDIQATGDYTLSLTVTDGNGITGNSYQLSVALTAPATPKPQPTVRPSSVSEETIGGDYWSMEVGNYDWDAIWQVMISPMTVVKGTGKQAERQTYKLRGTPSASGAIIGLVTCETQGVHVLETLDNGWTKIEVYNSSYGEAYRSAGKGGGYGNTDDLLQGYVETDRLDTFTPRTEYGLLIDKLTQELYIVTEKGLLSSLLVSTGFATKAQPWNETPAGEFYLSSKVGEFPSGNLICSYGMRFNNGDILHQVPYIYNEKYDLKDFSACEKYLGEKASHGCVRVQRKANDDGINMKWIWDNVPTRTKLLIWDDTGRPDPFMEYPVSPDTILFYNPNGGHYYHADRNCSSIKARFLPLQGSMTYAELDEPQYEKLTPCKHCNPPQLRMSEIDAINKENGYW